MIDISGIAYSVVAVTPDGEQLDITGITSELGWEEGSNELAVRISMQIYNAQFKGKYVSQIVQPGTPIFIYATIAGSREEVARGSITGWDPSWSNKKTSVSITAYDEMLALRKNQENRYYSDGVGTKAAIMAVFDDWGVPVGEYQGPDVTHTKMPFKKAWLSDIILKILDDADKKGAGKYIVRASKGQVNVIPKGSNTDVYHFGAEQNTVSIGDRFDSSNLITRVKVVGKQDTEGHQAVEAVIDGKTEFGIRQVIYERAQDKSLADATTAASQILKKKGDIDRKTTLSAPDVPVIRKGDRIHVSVGTASGYFFVTSIRHNAADGKMTMSIEEDKEKDAEETASTSNEEAAAGTPSDEIIDDPTVEGDDDE